MTNRVFPSKLLLFGEYTVLIGGKAIAVPLPQFGGELKFEEKNSTDQGLKELLHFYESNPDLSSDLNLKLFEQELIKGLYFHSDIPIGYGMGSSGALTAAIYDRYALHPLRSETELKKVFSKMEAFFHGESSGFDPLVSYLQRPILIFGNSVQRITYDWPENYDLYLIDSGIPRKTSKFVNIFLEKLVDKHLKAQLSKSLVEWNDQVISSLIKGNEDQLYSLFKKISIIQLNHFKEMIPHNLIDLWASGCESSDFKIKLCGAGGGGYFLAIVRKGVEFETLTNLRTMKLNL